MRVGAALAEPEPELAISLALDCCEEARPGASVDTGRCSLGRRECRPIRRVTLAGCSARDFCCRVRVHGSGGLVRRSHSNGTAGPRRAPAPAARPRHASLCPSRPP